MIDNPYISVLMVTYNSSKYLSDAIDSILYQTFKNFELIICDDNSKDASWSIIQAYKDHRIRAFRNEANIGEYSNRNKALSFARGDYCIFIDGDDLIYEYGLEILSRFTYSNSDIAMIIARNWDEKMIYPCVVSPKIFYCCEFLDKGIAAINFTKILFKTEVLKSIGGFDRPGIKMGDLYIQYRVAQKFNSLVIPDGFTWWRRTKGQASERILNDNSVFLEDYLKIAKFNLEQINDLLSQDEKHLVYINIYGNYLRFLLKTFLKFRLAVVLRLLKIHPIPKKYWASIFIKQKRDWLKNSSGSHPIRNAS